MKILQLLCLLSTLLVGSCRARTVPPAEVTGPAPVNTDALPLGSNTAADSLLIDLHAVDSTIRVNVRYAGANNFTGAPLPGYEASRALLHRQAALALSRVQARLRRHGLELLVFDGYRPVRATLAMVAWAERTGRRDLLDDGYIARRSRHNQGVAVDLTMVDTLQGTELDMGTPFDTFSEAAHTANASGPVLLNRQILVRAMEAERFSNYEKEWWHFSYPVPNALPFDKVIR